MGVIQIRRSQSQLGNLPNVKMVDTSGLATSSARGLETLGEGLTKGIIGTMKGVSDIAEWQLKMQEKENALITNEKLAKADEYIQRRLYDPNEGVLQMFEKDEDQVPDYIHNPETLQGNIKREVEKYIGYDKIANPQQKRLLDLKLQSIYTNVNKTLNTTASNLATARSQAASKKAVEYGIKNLARDPSQESLEDFDTFVNEYCDANFIPGEMRLPTQMELYEQAMSETVKEAIARCNTPSDVHAMKGWLERKDFGTRPDGGRKGPGWLGALRAKNGVEETECAVGIKHTDLTGAKHNVDIPLIVPTLTDDELDFLRKDYIPAEGNKEKQAELRESATYQEIFKKAVQHATPLLDEGKSAFAPSPFGSMDIFVDLLPESERSKLLGALNDELVAREKAIATEVAAREKTVQEQHSQVIDFAEVALLDGSYGSRDIEKLIQAARNDQWASKDVLRLQKLHTTAITREGNEAIAILEGIKDTKEYDKYYESLDPKIKRDPLFMRRWQETTERGVETARQMRQLGVKSAVTQLVYGGGDAMNIPLPEREKALREMAAQGEISPEECEREINKMKSLSNARIAHYANIYAGSVGGITSMLTMTTDPNGKSIVDVNKTLLKVYDYYDLDLEYSKTKDLAGALRMVEALERSWNTFSTWCEQNPNAEETEIEKTYKDCFRPAFSIFADKSPNDMSDAVLSAYKGFLWLTHKENELEAQDPTNDYKLYSKGDIEKSARNPAAPSNDSSKHYPARPNNFTVEAPNFFTQQFLQ